MTDLSAYVVQLNKLIMELNKVTRTTFSPNLEEIDRLSKEIAKVAEMMSGGAKK